MLRRMRDSEIWEWYKMSPARRFRESLGLWETFLLLGGTCGPEPDTQGPFDFAEP